jgi:hypothetical protein
MRKFQKIDFGCSFVSIESFQRAQRVEMAESKPTPDPWELWNIRFVCHFWKQSIQQSDFLLGGGGCSRIPCFRDSMLLGIAAGTVLGAARGIRSRMVFFLVWVCIEFCLTHAVQAMLFVQEIRLLERLRSLPLVHGSDFRFFLLCLCLISFAEFGPGQAVLSAQLS